MIAKVLELTLVRAGIRPQLVRDYLAAKESLAAAWDLVILDLMLPGGSGLELLRYLRQELKRSTPVLVLSGLKQERAAAEALALGAQAYLTKPFNPEDVLRFVEGYVAAR